MVGIAPDFTQTMPRTGRGFYCSETALLAILTSLFVNTSLIVSSSTMVFIPARTLDAWDSLRGKTFEAW